MTIDPLLFVSIAIVTPTVVLVHSIWLWRLRAKVEELEEIAYHLRLDVDFGRTLARWYGLGLGAAHEPLALSVLKTLSHYPSLDVDALHITRSQGLSQVAFNLLLCGLRTIGVITLEDGNASITLQGIRLLRELDDTKASP